MGLEARPCCSNILERFKVRGCQLQAHLFNASAMQAVEHIIAVLWYI